MVRYCRKNVQICLISATPPTCEHSRLSVAGSYYLYAMLKEFEWNEMLGVRSEELWYSRLQVQPL